MNMKKIILKERMNKTMSEDVTQKYIDMIDSFECDFSCAKDRGDIFSLSLLQYQLDTNSNPKLDKDIKLLKELSFGLRHGLLKKEWHNRFFSIHLYLKLLIPQQETTPNSFCCP